MTPIAGRPIVTAAEMRAAEERAIAAGTSVETLMDRAGKGVAAAVHRLAAGAPVLVLCGPGNNGGDGYVAAALLQRAGAEVRVWAEGAPREGTEAAAAADKYPAGTLPLSEFSPAPGVLVIDALYGAGLSRPLEGAAARAATLCAEKAVPVLAVDLPSGISGESGTAPASAGSTKSTCR